MGSGSHDGRRSIISREPVPRNAPSSAAPPASGQRQTRDSEGEFARLRFVVEAALRRVTSTRDPDYEDLIQSALEGVLQAIERAPPAFERSEHWVAAVARNITIDRLRARTRERRVFFQEDAESVAVPSNAPSSEPEHMTHVRKEIRRLDRALLALGPRRGVVVYLHDVLGYPLVEVAETIGTSVAAAQSRLVRGRHALLRVMRSRKNTARDFARSRSRR